MKALPSLPNVTPLQEEFLDRPKRLTSNGEFVNDPALRVVSYNILADQNAFRDVDKDGAFRMYLYCRNEHIVKWRRHP